MVEGLQKRQINQVYIIGGDGTQRGAHLLHQSIKTSKLDIALIGIPKTIDNDIPVIDKSFGF
jgi:6-phosphofructokinase 1